jgi:hypothetical protein
MSFDAKVSKMQKSKSDDDDKKKYKNITVDGDLVETLNSMADELVEQFGFRPTLSQTIRYLVKLQSGEIKK